MHIAAAVAAPARRRGARHERPPARQGRHRHRRRAKRREQTELLPCKRIGRPEKIAYTALFLASDEARFINATDMLVDGGRSQLYHD